MRFLSAPAYSFVLATACLASQANAATLTFSGSSFNISPPPAPGPPCASPLLNLHFGPDGTGGTSNLGAFTYTQAHCAVGGPGAYGGGVFQYFFNAGDMLSGTYSGALSPSGTTGLLNNTINYVVTAGTGRFLGATGTIDGIGTLDFRNGLPRADLALTGSIAAPAVPEPASWMMMIAGFGLAGGMMRRRVGATIVA